MTVSIADCPKTQSFYNWEPDQGINIDLIFLVIDIFVILLLLVGMESGFLQRHWKELKYKVKVSAHEAIDEVIGLHKGYHSCSPPTFQRLFKDNLFQYPDVDRDEDVEDERRAAEEAFGKSASESDSALVVRDMTKRFGSFEAVRGLSFTVKQGWY